jgi:hypothetical protein
MKSDSRSPNALLFLVSTALLACSSGCTIIGREEGLSLEFPNGAEPAAEQPSELPEQAAAPVGAATASITIEVRPDGKRAEINQIPLNGAPRIQEVLEQTKLVKRFRRMDIVLMRVGGDERHKLDSRYDHSKGWVNPLYDYQLHPGDHLVVTEDTSNVFDDVLGSLTPMKKRMQR